MSERRKLTESELGKLLLYQQLMSHQLSWCLAYAALFATVELGVLFLAIQLKEVENTGVLIIVGIVGFVIGLVFLGLYYVSVRQLDWWKDKILELTKLTDMEDDFKPWRSWRYRWNKATRGWMRLLWIVPLFVLLVWAWKQLVL